MNTDKQTTSSTSLQTDSIQLPNLIFVVGEDDVPLTSRVPGQKRSTVIATVGNEPAKKVEKPVEDELSPWVKDLMGLIDANGGLGSVAMGVVLAALPGGLMVRGLAAVAAATVTGVAAAANAKNEKAEKIRAIEGRAIQKYYDSHAVSLTWIARQKLVFAPGHPRLDVAYRLHPLANAGGGDHARHYIPVEGFDDLLLEERESELMRLLVDLGATRIVISEQRENDHRSDRSLDIKGGVADVADIEISAASRRASSNSASQSREFVLDGRDASDVRDIDEKEFAWLRFEPSWRALVKARQVGRCTRASIELKTEAAYSSHVSATARVALAGKGGGAAAESALLEVGRSTFLFQVEFGPITPPKTAPVSGKGEAR